MNSATTIEEIDRVYVPCDSCSSDFASLRCSRCKTTVYCNASCQKTHWPKHKSECKDFAQHIANGIAQQANMDMAIKKNMKTEQEGAECSICLSPIEQNAQYLPCSHCFCLTCAREHQMHSDNVNNLKCPMCRSDLGANLDVFIYKSAVMFIRRARTALDEEGNVDECNKFLRLFQKEWEKFVALGVVGSDNAPPSTHYGLLIRSLYPQMLFLQGSYQLCIDAAEETIAHIHSLGEEVPDKTPCELEMLRDMGECYWHLGNFEKAFDQCRRTFGIIDQPDKYINFLRGAYQALIKYSYSSGKYAKALQFGEAAVEMNRHSRGVYAYIVLSHKALGRRVLHYCRA
jgi:hypothetical protein